MFFSILLPAAPVLALLNNLVEFRSDAVNTIYSSRRTAAESVEDIGPWALALRMLSFGGILVNLGLLGATPGLLEASSNLALHLRRPEPRCGLLQG